MMDFYYSFYFFKSSVLSSHFFPPEWFRELSLPQQHLVLSPLQWNTAAFGCIGTFILKISLDFFLARIYRIRLYDSAISFRFFLSFLCNYFVSFPETYQLEPLQGTLTGFPPTNCVYCWKSHPGSLRWSPMHPKLIKKSTQVWAVRRSGGVMLSCFKAVWTRAASVLWMKLAPFVTIGSWKLQVSTNERSSRNTYLIRQLPLSLLSNYF